MTERLIERLKRDGYDVTEENGIVMVLWPDAETCEKEFEKIRKAAKEAGYTKSLGIRVVKRKKQQSQAPAGA